eukprot:SAG11_NODE_623_length_8115_cov_51.423278_3_plen_613_part_00
MHCHRCPLQLSGSKSWALWEVPELMLPLTEEQIEGRRPNETMAIEELGAPLLEVTLVPGDVLYVPRGMVHATHTLASGAGATSVALTVGVPQFRSGYYAVSYEALLGLPLASGAVWQLGLPHLAGHRYTRLRHALAEAAALLGAEDPATEHGWAAQVGGLHAAARSPARADGELQRRLGALLHALADAALRRTKLLPLLLADAAEHTAAAQRSGALIAATAAFDAERPDTAPPRAAASDDDRGLSEQPWPPLSADALADKDAQVAEISKLAISPQREQLPPAEEWGGGGAAAGAWLRRLPAAMERELARAAASDARFRESVPLGALPLPLGAGGSKSEYRNAAQARFGEKIGALLHVLVESVVSDGALLRAVAASAGCVEEPNAANGGETCADCLKAVAKGKRKLRAAACRICAAQHGFDCHCSCASEPAPDGAPSSAAAGVEAVPADPKPPPPPPPPPASVVAEAESLSRRAVSEAQRGKLEAALALFEEAAGVAPTAAIHASNVAFTLHRLRRYKEAMGWYDRALGLPFSKSQLADTWAKRGEAARLLGDSKGGAEAEAMEAEARRCFGEALARGAPYPIAKARAATRACPTESSLNHGGLHAHAYGEAG